MPAKAVSYETSGTAFRDMYTSKVWNFYLENDLTVGLKAMYPSLKSRAKSPLDTAALQN